MQIYTNEFLSALDKIEKDVSVAISELVNEINNDSMIECRNLSIGDSNEFGDGFSVKIETHGLDISNDIHMLTRPIRTLDGVSEVISKNTKKYIIESIEKYIEESEITVTKIRDVRKVVKVVLDQDVLIHNNNLVIKIGIGGKQ